MTSGTIDNQGAAALSPAALLRRVRLANAVWAVHTAIALYFFVAWALPWNGSQWSAVIGGSLLELHWWTNGGQCALTVLERRLRGLADVATSEETGFIAGLLESVFGGPVSQRWADAVTHGIVCGGAAIAVLRLAAS